MIMYHILLNQTPFRLRSTSRLTHFNCRYLTLDYLILALLIFITVTCFEHTCPCNVALFSYFQMVIEKFRFYRALGRN